MSDDDFYDDPPTPSPLQKQGMSLPTDDVNQMDHETSLLITYSNYPDYEYRDGELVPIESEPSPPPIFSFERLQFNSRIRDFNQTREEEAEKNERRLNEENVRYRRERFDEESEKCNRSQPYRILVPLPMEWRLRMVPYLDLMDQYYAMENSCTMFITNRLNGLRELLCSEEGMTNKAAWEEFEVLEKADEVRVKDQELKNDWKVMGKVLDGMEKQIRSQGESEELPENIMEQMGKFPELEFRFRELNGRKRMLALPLFPRRIASILPIQAKREGDKMDEGTTQKRGKRSSWRSTVLNEPTEERGSTNQSSNRADTRSESDPVWVARGVPTRSNSKTYSRKGKKGGPRY